MQQSRRKKYPELYSDEFIDFCLKNIVPLCPLAKNIKNKSEQNNTFKIIFITLFIISILLISQNGIYALIFGTIIFPCFFIYSISINFSLAKQININKEVIYPILFSYYPTCEYITSPLDINELENKIKNLKLFYFGIDIHIYHIEDIFKIKYKDLDIEMCEIFVSSRSTEDNNLNNRNGIKEGNNIFFKIERKNLSNEETIISSSKNQILDFQLAEKEIINLESIEFNKKFKVYSTSQIEARKILTPSFMEKLNDFCLLKTVRSINMSIDKNSINIIISHTKNDLFEVFYLLEDTKRMFIRKLRNTLIEYREMLSLLDELGIEHLSEI